MGFRVVFFKHKVESELSPQSEGKTVEETVEEIISLLKSNPKITARELQIKTGLSRRGVEWNIAKLKQEGKIERIGPTKSGYWKVIDNQ